MKYAKELELIEEFIENFDPDEFSSSDEFACSLQADERQKKAQKLKDKLRRKRELAEKFSASLDHVEVDDTEVMITQEQIDALLEGVN